MENQAGAKQNEPAAGPSRRTNTSDKAIQAQKLAQRLAAGDGRLALLLTQMADALSSLVDKSQEAVSQSAQGGQGEGEDEAEPLPLGDYEDLLQDWLASVHDIQLTLRKAIRFLVVAQHPPVLTASHSLVAGGGSNVAKAGRAAMPSHIERAQKAQKGEEADKDKGSAASDRGDEGEQLSLSAMRVQHQAWKDLLSTLEGLKAQQDARTTQDGGGGGGSGGGPSKWPSTLLDELIPPQIQR